VYLNYDLATLATTSQERKQYLLRKLFNSIKNCQRCNLAKQRTQVVPGDGNPNTNILLIGEAPGFNEDREGRAFVGQAGQLLDKILNAIQLSRANVYITNVVKCRPPDNRNPLPDECDACFPILQQQVQIIEPRFILILGRVAASVLLKTEDSITNLRRNVYDIFNAKAIVTYHPAALLRDPGLKRSTWEDVQQFQKLYQ
ncbi:MAG TPA: uracil-DNA glycosylase, partial [bacterium]